MTTAAVYNVKRSLTDGNFTTVIGSTAGSHATSYADGNLTNGVLYWYVVSATNSAGESANSASVSARPLPLVAPAAGFKAGPGGGIRVNAGTGAAAVTAVDAMGGIQYRLVYTEDLRSTNWNPVADWQTAGTNGPLALPNDPGATNSVQRFYRIEARKAP